MSIHEEKKVELVKYAWEECPDDGEGSLAETREALEVDRCEANQRPFFHLVAV